MIRYKLVLIIALALMLLLIAACAVKPKTFSDFDARHDFTLDKTFSWAQDPPVLKSGNYVVSSIAVSRMTAAIKKQFLAKGFNFIEDPEKADIAVTYTMGARDKIELIDRTNGYYAHTASWGWGYYYFPYFVHFPFDRHASRYRERLPRNYTEGTIAVDIFDTKTKQPIWHAKVSKRLSSKELHSNLDNADEIALRLLEDYPLIGCKPVISKQCNPF